MNPKLELKLIGGGLLWYPFAPTADGQSATLEAEIVQDGTCLLLAEDADHGSTGAYEVSISKVTPQDVPRSIEYGQTVEGMIAPDLQARTYTFEGKSGDFLYIALSSNDRDYRYPEFEVHDPTGTLIANGSVANRTIPGSSGKFVPRLTKSPESATCEEFATVEGDLDTPGNAGTPREAESRARSAHLDDSTDLHSASFDEQPIWRGFPLREAFSGFFHV